VHVKCLGSQEGEVTVKKRTQKAAGGVTLFEKVVGVKSPARGAGHLARRD
jgi:hypothetical protein